MALTSDQPAGKKVLCVNCDSGDSAQSRCNDCGVFLCQFCTESHKRYRSTKHHQLSTMEELKSIPAPQNIAEKIRCSKHKEEVIKLFCKTCQTTICSDCTIVDHRTHQYGFVEEVAMEEKKHLQSKLNEVKQRKDGLAQGIINLKYFDERLDEHYWSTVLEISGHFDELAEAVELRRKEMLEKTAMFTRGKKKQIATQLEVLQIALASCETGIEFTEKAFKNGNDTQILSMEKYILQSLDQLKAVKDQTNPSVTEDMVFTVPSSVPETNETLLKRYDVDVAVVSPSCCTASFKGEDKIFNAGKHYFITLISNDKNKQRLRYGNQIIKPSFTGMEVREVSVTDNHDGSYTIGFCPHQGGMLKFEVSINKRPAPNCSLTKQVKWVISEIHGNGTVSNRGLTMTGGEGYCWRVGACYFESGIHTWKVQLSFDQDHRRGYYYNESGRCEVGIIDVEEFNKGIVKREGKSIQKCFERKYCFGKRKSPKSRGSSAQMSSVLPYPSDKEDIGQSKKKWVQECSVTTYNFSDISFTLDMENKTLKVEDDSRNRGHSVSDYQFTARRVSPFFACNSPNMNISLVQ